MTLKEARAIAVAMIERGDPIVNVVATDMGQRIHEVRDTRWFRDAVAIYIMGGGNDNE